MGNESYDAPVETYDVAKEETRARRDKIYAIALLLLFLNGLILLIPDSFWLRLLAVIDLVVTAATVLFHWLVSHEIVKR